MRFVLVVEDDRDQLAVRKLTLETAGYRVEAAENPGAALASFEREEPDAVIMDLRLPRTEDGLALIRELRGRSVAVRIVVLSGWASDLANRPEKLLIDHALAKPVRTRQMLTLLGEA
jgi:DNA-binding response OmpR family regulator